MSLTAEQVAEFDGYMQKWQAILGLQGWRVERQSKIAKGSTLAEVVTVYEDRTAFYKVGDWKPDFVTSFNLEQTAVHELLHVLLCDLKHAIRKEADGETVMGLEHGIVNLLEKLLMKAN